MNSSNSFKAIFKGDKLFKTNLRNLGISKKCHWEIGLWRWAKLIR